MLKIDRLNVYYGESYILRDVSLEVPQGEVVCLMGRNGVGKTTLLKSIMGLLPASSGAIYFDGENITSQLPNQRAKRGIAYVPQGREIFAQLTVYENLLIGLQARTDKKREMPEEIFNLFPVLKTMLNRRGGDLSGGQQQQLAIGRALVSQPKLLLLDEPTEGIQPSIILEIEEVLQRIRQTKTTSILLVEQYLQFAKRLGDFYYIMQKGTIVSEGTTEELTEDVVKMHLTV